MEPHCANCQRKLTPHFKYNRTTQYYKMCDSCRPIKSNVNVDCINYDRFNGLITDLNESIETSKQVLKDVEGERSAMLGLIQTMNSVLMKFKIKSDSGADTDIRNESIKLTYRINDVE